ncbi:uncharacterized protein EI97DRAFT_454643 [Westerdykella ornata]|uniref:BHLH domain-containing protein n=1 Tax=Westerdykella ornata TaxID=318751 RepID=A0A6A6K235_WESOR|nr:uncharacterized protein EI97DRAFT_454643 [Westerdykella ornata]KAF2281449.1 hypothetical protein EI97DRAFT_454643 [Westerdykella ornata]
MQRPFHPMILDDEDLSMPIDQEAFHEPYFTYDGLSTDKPLFDHAQFALFSLTNSCAYRPPTYPEEERPTIAPSQIMWNPTFGLASTEPCYGAPAYSTSEGRPTTTSAQQHQQTKLPPFGPPGPIHSLRFSSPASAAAALSALDYPPRTRAISRTPSLCGDGPSLLIKPEPSSPQSPQLSPSPGFFPSKSQQMTTPSHCLSSSLPTMPTPTTRIPSSSLSSPSLKPVHRTRGRPRTSSMPQHSTTKTKSLTSPTGSPGAITKTPSTHKDVERKYRRGINNDLERLRRAIPSLRSLESPESSDAKEVLQGQQVPTVAMAKPTKSQVLAAAVEYIRRLEGERNGLRREVALLSAGAAAVVGV